MKILFAQVLVCGLLLTVTLTSCDTKQHASSNLQTSTTTSSSSETSTTSKTNIVSAATSNKAHTTTDSTTSTTTTVTISTKATTATTSKPTKKTTKLTKTAEKATTATTELDPNAPYEDDSLIPGNDKQRLLFNAEGGEIELVFEKAMRYPADNNAILWHYIGTTKKGMQITCTVVPEQNAIREIAYDVNTDFGPMTYEKDARACLERFLKAYDIPYKADNAQISHSMAAKRGENGTVFHINWRFSLPLKENDGILGGKIGLINGKLVVHSLYASSVLEGERVFGYSGDDIPLLIPRWKSE